MFRTASRALITQDGQLLAVKYQEEGKAYYALPGGGQEDGESLLKNLQRVCREELGIDVKLEELIFVREWINEESDVHQIEFIFKCLSHKKIGDVHSEIPDGNQVGIEWIPIVDISNYHIYPLQMRKRQHNLMDGDKRFPVYLGCDN